MKTRLRDLLKNNKLLNIVSNRYNLDKEDRKTLNEMISNQGSGIYTKFYKIKLNEDIVNKYRSDVFNLLDIINAFPVLLLYINNRISIAPIFSLYKRNENSYIYDVYNTKDLIMNILENPTLINSIYDYIYDAYIYVAYPFDNEYKTLDKGPNFIEYNDFTINFENFAIPITEQEYLDKLNDTKEYTLEDLQQNQ